MKQQPSTGSNPETLMDTLCRIGLPERLPSDQYVARPIGYIALTGVAGAVGFAVHKAWGNLDWGVVQFVTDTFFTSRR